MPKILYFKMDEEIEKIKYNFPSSNIEQKTKVKKSKSFFSFSIKLFLVRLMLISMFICFSILVYKLIVKKNLLEINIFKSHRLLNSKNIHQIYNLNISLNIEYKKFVHLKITDKDNKRWEVPKEILNQEYFDNINNKNHEKNKKEENEENELFKIDIKGLNDDDNSNKRFSFDLYFESNDTQSPKEKNIFYSFKIDKNFIFSDNLLSFESRLTSDDIYGFGERIHDFKLEEGVYTIWPIDQKNYLDDGKGGKNLYGHQPIGLHKTKYKQIWLGFVFLNSNAQDVQIHKNTLEEKIILSHKTIGGILDYYIIVDNSPENVVKSIHFLLGYPKLPPYWAMGVHQCRWGFKNTSDFENAYNTYKEKEIPLDAMWIDIDAMDNFEIFTLNKKKFDDLPDVIDNNIHKDHTKFIPIIDIGLLYDEDDKSKYAEIGDKNNLFIKSGYTNKNLYAKVWPKKTVFPDFFNPNIDKIWDKGLNDYYDIIKYDGIWLDMNEPSHLKKDDICPGEIFENEKDIKKYEKLINQNLEFSYLPGYIDNINSLTTGSISLNGITYNNEILYNNKPLLSVYQSRQTYNFLKNKISEHRPFILSRATSFGSGNYAFHWLGDNFSKNEYIKYSISGIFNFNIFGIPFTGADICGFNKNANGDLCARWYNIGAFYPFSRNHNSIRYIDQYPWSFGEKVENIIKKDIQIRYSLIRYFYSQMFLVSLNEKGSFFKPIMFEFPEDKNSYNDIESKVMLGEAFLILVFFGNEETNKTFILPNSNFNSYPSGDTILTYSEKSYSNLRKKNLSGKLNELYIFLRGGYIVPTQNTFDKYIMNTYSLRHEKLNLIINPNQDKYAKGTIFYDNDESDTIENEKYIRVDMEFKDKILNIDVKNLKNIKYKYKDNIINKIEILRMDEIIDINKYKNNIKLKIELTTKKNKNIKSKLDINNNKIIIDFNAKKLELNMFTMKKIYLN